ncbi:MFS transporter [Amycolatopsis australiensis]|uniref:Major Facilitator Superfamily protein n=1 Tax=Amycolatopsis australiensis TaxID=546364 RepID=A0A1K1RQD4_9PSEU|nr:MFS transporter [Amycolatopsis australiensis]SFW74483.1 Major Facilitator Superfamily protein [Amycolatopsis australiensis]
MHASRRLAFAGLLLGMAIAQLDGLIVTAALPSIGADLHARTGLVAVTGAGLLTLTVATPLHGRLGDLHGRRICFAGSVVVFAAASAWCAAAPDIGSLIAARALQGLGGSGLIVTAMSALGELFDRDELLRRQGRQMAVFAAATLGGPPLGGLLAAGPGWRWIFLVNLPLCVAALVLGLRGLPGKPARAAGKFDVGSSVLLVVAGSAVVATGTFDGLARSPLWTPVLVVSALTAGFLFVRRQRRTPSPLISPAVFADTVLKRAVVVNGLAGAALYGTFTYVALVAALRADAAGTGVLLVAMTAGQLALSASFAALARKQPEMTAWGRFGCLLGTAGLAAVAVAAALRGTPWLLVPGLFAIGAAFAACTSAYTVLGQTRARSGLMGVTMGSLTFARQAGGLAGAAVFGWLALATTGGLAAPGLTVVFAAAAAVMLVSRLTAPAVTSSAAVSSSS